VEQNMTDNEGARVAAVRKKVAFYTYEFEQYDALGSGNQWPYRLIDLREGKNFWSMPCTLTEAEAVVAGDPDEKEFDRRVLALKEKKP
jgi:hypothetical protein